MSFSRYSLEKKQISLDRGVTWEDVTPSETRLGELIGVARTLLECEDLDCDLEEDRYELVDGELPSEFCGEFVLPEGIAKQIQFTNGAYCYNDWYYCNPTAIDYMSHDTVEIGIGKRRCWNGYCPSWEYSSPNINGLSITGCCYDVAHGIAYVCTCFNIVEFMPYIGEKESWKTIQKQHYVRAHCSEEWVKDGEPEMVGIGERWKFISDDFYSETWQHQIANTIDDSGNVLTWIDDGEADVYYYDNVELEHGVEIIDGLKADGQIYSEYSIPFTSLSVSVKKDSGDTPSGVIVDMGGYSGGSVNYLSIDYYPPSSAITTEYKYFGCHILNPLNSGNKLASMFCYGSGSNVLNDCIVGSIRQGYTVGYMDGEPPADAETYVSIQNRLGTLFPYKIPYNYGCQDDFYNSLEYGFIDRDNTRYPFVRRVGVYTDTNNENHTVDIYGQSDWGYILKMASNVGNEHYAVFYVTSSAVKYTQHEMCTVVPDEMCRYNNTITAVTLPVTLVYIGQYAFKDCPNLISLTVRAVTPPAIYGGWDGDMLGTYNPDLRIYVPRQSVDAYKNASGWRLYSSIILPIP